MWHWGHLPSSVTFNAWCDLLVSLFDFDVFLLGTAMKPRFLFRDA